MSLLQKITEACEEMIVAREKATAGPWSYDIDENEIHSDSRQDFGGDPAHICEMMVQTGRKFDTAQFITHAANNAAKLASALRICAEAIQMECYCEKLHPDKDGKCGACEALQRAAEVLVEWL